MEPREEMNVMVRSSVGLFEDGWVSMPVHLTDLFV